MRRAGKIIIILGILLVLCGFGIMLLLEVTTDRAELDSADILSRLKELLPPETIGAPEEYSDTDMPALELDGRDIIGLLTIQPTGTELPVAAEWNKKTLISFPQRFSGSTYDSSLVIGGYDRKGQFDCLKTLDVGNEISVTDMTGAKFTYTVSDIKRKKSVEGDVLTNADSDLTLFVCDSETNEYIVVYCTK